MSELLSSVKIFPDKFPVPLNLSTRGHRVIQLTNGILALIISDPTKDSASAALCVATGAHDDPDDLAGLAHFCEHMLFLGTKDFPNAETYHQTISSSGGSYNAYTTGEQTCFYFQVPVNSSKVGDINNKIDMKKYCEEPVFNYVLKNFSSFFKNPLFSTLYSQREIFAVDNEHTSNKTSPSKIFYQAAKILANPNHPFHRFATGNILTLHDLPSNNNINLKDALVQHFKENYSPDKMTLVLRGPQSVNYLQKLAVANFSDITTAGIKKKSRDHSVPANILKSDLSEFSIKFDNWAAKYPGPVYRPEDMNKCIYIKNETISKIRIVFPIHYKKEDVRKVCLFERAWATLLGDEGEGSLCTALKKSKNLISGMLAFPQTLSQGNDILILEIKLNRQGLKKVQGVIELIFAYFQNIVLKADTNEMGRFLSESSSIDYLNYLYQISEDPPMDEASDMSSILQDDLRSLKPKNIFKGYPNWDDDTDEMSNPFKGGYYESEDAKKWWIGKAEEFISFCATVLSLNNFNIVAIHSDSSIIDFLMKDRLNLSKNSIFDNFQSSTTYDMKDGFLKDLYYQFEYRKLIINPLLFSISETVGLNLPKPNPFLPKEAYNHMMMKRALDSTSNTSSNLHLSFVTKNASSTTPPTLIEFSPSHEIWFKNESNVTFTSHAFISFEMISQFIEPSPAVVIACQLLCEFVTNELQYKLYPAELIGYRWALFPATRGDGRIGITVSGFNDGIDEYFHIITQELKNFSSKIMDVSYNDFKKARVNIRTKYEELLEKPGVVLASVFSVAFLEESTWSLDERLEALEELDLEEVKNILDSIFNNQIYASVLIHGDYSLDKIKNFTATVLGLTHNYGKSPRSSSIFNLKEPSSYLMQPGKSYHYKTSSAKGDSMHTIFYYIQMGLREDIYTRTLSKLIAFLMSITVVSDLRTKKQLGYVILSGLRLFRKSVGVYISVMSSSYNPTFLEDKIDEYLCEWEEKIIALDEEEFQKTIIQPFLKSYLNSDKTSNAIGGPPSITMTIEPANGSIGFNGDSIKQHRGYWDHIINRTYRFESSPGDDEIDLSIIKKLSKSQFIRFFYDRISPKSPRKSKISIMLKSTLSSQEIAKETMKLQLQVFLRMKGLIVPSDILADIVDRCEGNSGAISKELLKYFGTKGESIKFVIVGLREVIKAVIGGLSFRTSKSHSNGSIESLKKTEKTKLEDLEQFHRDCSVIDNYETVFNKLQDYTLNHH